MKVTFDTKLEERWICTDPSVGQFRLDEGQNVWKDTIFTFYEGGIRDTINIEHYSEDEITDVLSTYGYYKKGKSWYGSDTIKISNDIIAECIFETHMSNHIQNLI